MYIYIYVYIYIYMYMGLYFLRCPTTNGHVQYCLPARLAQALLELLQVR